MKADITIDCVGLYCPVPIIKTAEQVQKMANGQILEVIADDEGITSDMPNWCQMTGHEFLGIEKADMEYHTFVKKIVK